ncbi:MAG: hypothetical protein C4589_02855 [Peptococcaceae bacterium]|nr:MAG: hypothetical protein C4589_02855 [Peptococcaceae bacterium]
MKLAFGHIRRQEGFSLVEIALAVLLVTVLLTAVLALYGRGVNAWNYGEKRAEVNDSLRIGMDRLGRELREATALSPATTASELRFYGRDGMQIRYFIYNSADGNQLNREKVDEAGTNKPVASNLTGLSLTYSPYGPGPDITKSDLVTVTLTGRDKDEKLDPVAMTTTVRLRAYN